jgi:hypothetical protein
MGRAIESILARAREPESRTESAIATAEGDLLTPLDQEQREQLYALLR